MTIWLSLSHQYKLALSLNSQNNHLLVVLYSAQCVEDTKSFITSVVVGKDVVPRIGLHQLEAMRQDLINVIKKSTQPKVSADK